ncbi:MAG: alpha/beta fold hydrolase [Lawsonella sp.]
MRRISQGLLAAFAAVSLSFVSSAVALAAPQTPIPDYTPARPGEINKDGIPGGKQGAHIDNFLEAQTFSLKNPGTNPKGANDFNCKPKPGQLPLILLSGTGEDAFKVWADYSPRFKELGYCVFAPNLNTASFSESQTYTGDIIGSAEAFGKFVQMVLKATGASKVNVIGHSQGAGTLPLAYIKWFDGYKYIHKLIGLAPGNHGTTVLGLDIPYKYLNGEGNMDPWLKKVNMQGWTQQMKSNSFNKQLDANNIDFGEVQYTTIMTKYDEIITPYTSGIINQPGVNNIVIQDVCKQDFSDHLSFSYDNNAFQMALAVLRDQDPTKNIKCEFVPPLFA